MFGEHHQQQHLLEIILLEARRQDTHFFFWKPLIILKLYNVCLTAVHCAFVWINSIPFGSLTREMMICSSSIMIVYD